MRASAATSASVNVLTQYAATYRPRAPLGTDPSPPVGTVPIDLSGTVSTVIRQSSAVRSNVGSKTTWGLSPLATSWGLSPFAERRFLHIFAPDSSRTVIMRKLERAILYSSRHSSGSSDTPNDAAYATRSWLSGKSVPRYWLWPKS